MEIRWYNTASEISATLWNESFPVPLEGQWWYSALEQSGLEDQFQFFYGVVLHDSTPVAIAPAFVMNVPISQVVPEGLLLLFKLLGKIIPALLYQRTLFIGSPCADEGTVGIITGLEHYPVLQYIQEAMTQKAEELRCSMFAWKDFPQSYNNILTQISKEHGLFPLASFPGTCVDFESNYLASLKSSHRHTLKKKLRRSTEQVKIDTQVLQHPDAATLDEIFALFQQTYKKATTKFEELNRLFFTNIAACPASHFIILREQSSSEMLAFMLCFVFPERIINKFIGIDYYRPREWFLYFRLWEAAVQFAEQRRVYSIQSGQTGYKPKLETGHKLIALTHYCRHSNPLIHYIYKTFAKTVSWSTLDTDLAIYAKAHPVP